MRWLFQCLVIQDTYILPSTCIGIYRENISTLNTCTLYMYNMQEQLMVSWSKEILVLETSFPFTF